MAKRKFEKGDMVEVFQDTTGHRQPVGTTGVIKGRQNGYYFLEEFPNVYFMPADLQKYSCTVETLNAEIADKEKEIVELRAKITYLEETKVEKFCPREFRAYQTLKLLQDDGSLSLMEKARRVAELYK